MHTGVCVAKDGMFSMAEKHNTYCQDRGNLDCGCHVEQVCAAACAEHIHDCDYKNHQRGYGLHAPWGQCDEFAEVAAESDRQSGNGSRTDYEKQRPSEQKTEKRPITLANINIKPTRLRLHR